MYETKHKADVDTDLNDQIKDVTANFVVKTEDINDDPNPNLKKKKRN